MWNARDMDHHRHSDSQGERGLLLEQGSIVDASSRQVFEKIEGMKKCIIIFSHKFVPKELCALKECILLIIQKKLFHVQNYRTRFYFSDPKKCTPTVLCSTLCSVLHSQYSY